MPSARSQEQCQANQRRARDVRRARLAKVDDACAERSHDNRRQGGSQGADAAQYQQANGILILNGIQGANFTEGFAVSGVGFLVGVAGLGVFGFNALMFYGLRSTSSVTRVPPRTTSACKPTLSGACSR